MCVIAPEILTTEIEKYFLNKINIRYETVRLDNPAENENNIGMLKSLPAKKLPINNRKIVTNIAILYSFL